MPTDPTTNPTRDPDATPVRFLDAPGVACVALTPLIEKTLRELPAGGVPSCHSDDAAAREGVPAWCRLTRHELLAVIEHGPASTTFAIAQR